MTFQKALARIRIPRHIQFSDLQLQRHAGRDVSFEHSIIAAILQESGIPAAVADQSEDLSGGIISAWYRLHIDGRGAPDPVMEALIAEERTGEYGQAN